MAATNCIDTLLFGQVCDSCDGGAILKVVAACIKIASAGILVAATIAIIVCGVMIITSRDNASQIAKAKKRMIEIIIGIVLYALMFTVANFIIPGGIVESTTDTTTTSCPENKSLDGDGDEDTGGEEGGGDDKPTGKYPMAHRDDEKIPGYIQCPRNANYTYIKNPLGKEIKEYEKLDEYFQSQAHSCPFTEVKYTHNEQDLACDAGGKMHYVEHNGNKWCIVNSKIDVFQFQQYLTDNHIGQDGKTCSASAEGEDCKWGSSDPYKYFNDYGACYYFSITFASNLNNGEVVSNDAYAAQAGFATHHAIWGRTRFGNTTADWFKNKGFARYEDNYTGIALGGPNMLPLGPTGDFSYVRKGQAVAFGCHNPNRKSGNCGHYVTVIGFTTACAGGKDCDKGNLVILNTNGRIGTLMASGYVAGYDRCGG